MSAGQVDDGQASKAQCGVSGGGGEDAAVVRASMGQGVGHASDGVGVGASVVGESQDASDSTHSNIMKRI